MKKKTANKRTIETDLQMNRYRMQYSKWKHKNHMEKMGFFPLFNSFKNSHLKTISGGALKAYLYFGFHANNDTGESWHSVERMSDFFEVDLRTVKKWVAELENQGLIERIQIGYKRAANTFLKPYYEPELLDEDNEKDEEDDKKHPDEKTTF